MEATDQRLNLLYAGHFLRLLGGIDDSDPPPIRSSNS
jgi:hypothetical protein